MKKIKLTYKILIDNKIHKNQFYIYNKKTNAFNQVEH